MLLPTKHVPCYLRSHEKTLTLGAFKGLCILILYEDLKSYHLCVKRNSNNVRVQPIMSLTLGCKYLLGLLRLFLRSLHANKRRKRNRLPLSKTPRTNHKAVWSNAS